MTDTEEFSWEPKPPAPSDDANSRIFYTNVGLIVAFGIIVSSWLEFYTDWFPLVGTLLSLGGVLSWVAFVSRWMPEARMRALIERTQKALFGTVGLHRHLLFAMVLLILAFNFAGGIQIESSDNLIGKTLEIQRVGWSANAKPISLRAGERIRAVRLTSWLFPGKFRVKISGYPDQIVEVNPWERMRLTVPASFLRPVILLRANRTLFDEIVSNPVPLEIGVGNTKMKIDKYHGEAIWIGCERDVDVPPSLVDEWRKEPDSKDRPLPKTWVNPIDLGSRIELNPGDEVVATINNSESRFKVLHLYRPQDFPQVEYINGRRN